MQLSLNERPKPLHSYLVENTTLLARKLQKMTVKVLRKLYRAVGSLKSGEAIYGVFGFGIGFQGMVADIVLCKNTIQFCSK
jgi:hypothetical protein